MEVLAPGGTVILFEGHREWYHWSLSQYPTGRVLATGRLPGIRKPSVVWMATR
jgi:hypothetical protein